MNTRYRELFGVEFFHEFYKNKDDTYSQRDNDFEVIPTAQCSALMRNQGWLFRRVAGGFKLLYRAAPDNVSKPLIDFPARASLSFLLRAKTPWLEHYTALPLQRASDSIFYLTNLAGNVQQVDGKDELLLTKDSTNVFLSAQDEVIASPPRFHWTFKKAADKAVISILDQHSGSVFTTQLERLEDGSSSGAQKNFCAAIDLTAFGKGLYHFLIDGVESHRRYVDEDLTWRKPFALLDMKLHPHVPTTHQFAEDDGSVAAKHFRLRLNKRETIWKYLVGVKYREDIAEDDLQIISASFPATFTRKASYRLADNTRIIPFDSDLKLPLRQEPIKGIKLKRTLSAHGAGSGSASSEEIALPNPEVANLKTENNQLYSEVYIYV
jgi:hypothetical protein